MIRQQALKALKSAKFGQKPYFTTVSDCHLWTAIINHILFAGAVPKYRKVSIKRLSGVYARCCGHVGLKGQLYCTLEVHPKFPSFTSFYSILLHELIHAHEWSQSEKFDHGDFFLSHEELAAKVGVSLRESYKNKGHSQTNDDGNATNDTYLRTS
jgi:hypothetical protein